MFLDGNEDGHFAVELRTNVLHLVKELNRAEREVHVITIAATNSETPPSAQNNPNSLLTVTVNVSTYLYYTFFLRQTIIRVNITQ